VRDAGKPAWDWTAPAKDEAFIAKVNALAEGPLRAAYQIRSKQARTQACRTAAANVFAALTAEGVAFDEVKVEGLLFEIEARIVRGQILAGEPRIDGRDTRTVRPIEIRNGVLPRVHGSAEGDRAEEQDERADPRPQARRELGPGGRLTPERERGEDHHGRAGADEVEPLRPLPRRDDREPHRDHGDEREEERPARRELGLRRGVDREEHGRDRAERGGPPGEGGNGRVAAERERQRGEAEGAEDEEHTDGDRELRGVVHELGDPARLVQRGQRGGEGGEEGPAPAPRDPEEADVEEEQVREQAEGAVLAGGEEERGGEAAREAEERDRERVAPDREEHGHRGDEGEERERADRGHDDRERREDDDNNDRGRRGGDEGSRQQLHGCEDGAEHAAANPTTEAAQRDDEPARRNGEDDDGHRRCSAEGEARPRTTSRLRCRRWWRCGRPVHGRGGTGGRTTPARRMERFAAMA